MISDPLEQPSINNYDTKKSIRMPTKNIFALHGKMLFIKF